MLKLKEFTLKNKGKTRDQLRYEGILNNQNENNPIIKATTRYQFKNRLGNNPVGRYPAMTNGRYNKSGDFYPGARGKHYHGVVRYGSAHLKAGPFVMKAKATVIKGGK